MFRKRPRSVNPTCAGFSIAATPGKQRFSFRNWLRVGPSKGGKNFLFQSRGVLGSAVTDQRAYDSPRLIGLAQPVAPWQFWPMENLIKHSCGHEQMHAIHGTFAADIDRQVVRLARQKCKSCFLAGKKAADDARAAADAPIIAELVLAGLQGSPKQIAWADGIRAKRVAALHRQGHQGVLMLAAVAEAKWWIDHRDAPDDALLALCPVAPLPGRDADGMIDQAISNNGRGPTVRIGAALG